MSHLARSNRLFSEAPWLPLRRLDTDVKATVRIRDCESLEFQTKDGLTLRGSFFRRISPLDRGTILYIHEMNGNRWSVLPYLDKLRQNGFNLLTFDQRGHGESDSSAKSHPTPWVTRTDLDDVRAVIEGFCSLREYSLTHEAGESLAHSVEKDFGLGVFGSGKGATLALCSASLDSRVQAVVMDSPAPEGRLYEKNCLTAFAKSGKLLATHHFAMFLALSLKTLVYLAACPVFSLVYTWQRFMFSLWCGGNFVNTWKIIKKQRKPILILHDGLDSCVSLPQIHSFCHRMTVRPQICIAHHQDEQKTNDSSFSPFCTNQITAFFAKALKANELSLSPPKVTVAKRDRFFSRSRRPLKSSRLLTK